MPLIRIQRDQGVKHVFIAGAYIADLASLELVAGERQVMMGVTGHEHLAAGVSRGSSVSGALVRVITQGIISGVKIASGYTVAYGDRLMLATSGAVRPLNTITPAGAISGYIPAGAAGLFSGLIASGLGSGILSGLRIPLSGYVGIATPSIFSSGALAGTAFNTGRVLGRALTSGGSGMAAIQMMVCLE